MMENNSETDLETHRRIALQLAQEEIATLKSQQRNWTLEARELTQYGRTGVVDVDPEGMKDIL